MHRQPEGRCELPMEMELGECGHAAQLVQVQIAVEMLINVIQDPLHPGMVVSKRRRHYLVLAVAEPNSPAQALYARPILRITRRGCSAIASAYEAATRQGCWHLRWSADYAIWTFNVFSIQFHGSNCSILLYHHVGNIGEDVGKPSLRIDVIGLGGHDQ